MRALLRTLLILVVGLPLVGGVAAWFAIEPAPLVTPVGLLDADSVRRATAILREHDPRNLTADGVRTVELMERDLNLALGYAASRFARGGADVTLSRHSARVRLSWPVDKAAYLNVDATVRESNGRPWISALRLGAVPIPAALAQWAAGFAARQSPELADGTSLVSLVRSVELSPARVRLTYRWRAGLLDELRANVLDATDRSSIEAYHRALVQTATRLRPGDSVTSVLQTMFSKAAERSTSLDPVLENRAVLIVLSAYVSGRDLARFVPAAQSWPVPAQRRLRLHGRRDLAQHFLISAGLAALGGGTLADTLGLFKEVTDARFGSGFSFTDIAADRSGTRFGELAIASPASARRLQRWATQGLTDVDLLPHPRHLPEFFSEAQFRERFGYVDSPRYRAVMADIEARIAARGLYREGVTP